jgi:hypothetical protein
MQKIAVANFRNSNYTIPFADCDEGIVNCNRGFRMDDVTVSRSACYEAQSFGKFNRSFFVRS